MVNSKQYYSIKDRSCEVTGTRYFVFIDANLGAQDKRVANFSSPDSTYPNTHPLMKSPLIQLYF